MIVRGSVLREKLLADTSASEENCPAMGKSRRRMALDLRHALPAEHQPLALRPLIESDAPGLANLMLAAFRGTVDDEGEDLDQAGEEVRRTFSGGYGRLLWNASFVVEGDPTRPALLSASVITFWQDLPLLSFSVTHPQAGRRGLATALIRRSALILAGQGYARLDLFVTRGNTPAERLYEKLGFHDVERI
jgi:ribosomal protein S18 acetylase RimI-like enzyme